MRQENNEKADMLTMKFVIHSVWIYDIVLFETYPDWTSATFLRFNHITRAKSSFSRNTPYVLLQEITADADQAF